MTPWDAVTDGYLREHPMWCPECHEFLFDLALPGGGDYRDQCTGCGWPAPDLVVEVSP